MTLRTKFNLLLLIIFSLGITGSGIVCYRLLGNNAREEVMHNAGIMLEAASAVRRYTVEQVRPHLWKLIDNKTFLPQTVPAYAATEVFNNLRKEYQEYRYKEATLNPTNLRDRAADWEADVINEFRNDPTKSDLVGERDTPNGRSLFVARPLTVNSAPCLNCHSVPSAAPISMIKLYGDSNGFGWKLNEAIGAQIVSVPMDVPIKNAKKAFYTFMGSLVLILLVIFVVLNVMLHSIIIKPIVKMAKVEEAVSLGNMDIPEFVHPGSDEVARLSNSFNRMRRSLEKAMKMIED